MRWAALTLLLPAVTLAQDQPNEAEKLFRAMEEKIAKAETIQVTFEGQFEGIPESKWTGTLVAAKKNKVRLECDGETIGQGKYLVVSDGVKLVINEPKGKPRVEPVPDKMGEHLLRQFTRSTTWPMRVPIAISTEADKRLVLTVSDFKLKGKEKLGKVETHVITYTMKIEKDDEVRASVMLWIDALTQLPAKRVQRWFKDEPPSIDLFGEWKLGKKLDAKLFAVPK